MPSSVCDEFTVNNVANIKKGLLWDQLLVEWSEIIMKYINLSAGSNSSTFDTCKVSIIIDNLETAQIYPSIYPYKTKNVRPPIYPDKTSRRTVEKSSLIIKYVDI